MTELRRWSRIPFSAHRPDVELVAELGAPDALVVSLGFAGGLRGTRRPIAQCEKRDVRFRFYSGDLGIATAAYLHVAAATPYLDLPSQSLLRWTTEDVATGGPPRASGASSPSRRGRASESSWTSVPSPAGSTASLAMDRTISTRGRLSRGTEAHPSACVPRAHRPAAEAAGARPRQTSGGSPPECHASPFTALGPTAVAPPASSRRGVPRGVRKRRSRRARHPTFWRRMPANPVKPTHSEAAPLREAFCGVRARIGHRPAPEGRAEVCERYAAAQASAPVSSAGLGSCGPMSSRKGG
jgi:hypothetical protein